MDTSNVVQDEQAIAESVDPGIKQPKTYDQQLEIIKLKGFVVNNDKECIEFLKQVNYYRFFQWECYHIFMQIYNRGIRNL